MPVRESVRRWKAAYAWAVQVVKQERHDRMATLQNRIASRERQLMRQSRELEKLEEENKAAMLTKTVQELLLCEKERRLSSGKGAVTIPSLSDREKMHGIRVERLEKSKYELAKRREEAKQKQEEQDAIRERMARFLRIGDAINR